MRCRRFGTQVRSKTYAQWSDYERTIRLPSLFAKRVHLPQLCVICKHEPNASYADEAHMLVIPQPLLSSDSVGSVPYPFPWSASSHRIDWQQVEWIITMDDSIVLHVEGE
ncbi:MAG: hypothetical protein MN733_43285, partial [Nitrososphaera sp.]|nr:hypothetical protein [Nitrososphaera sp.]